MPDSKLFPTGFPGPTPTAQEVDSLSTRIAQSAGVRDAAAKRGQAMAEQSLAAPMTAADTAVDAMIAPLNQTLSDAGTTAAQAVVMGQSATVKALQAPLVTALKQGYQSQGTPVISPAVPRKQRKAAPAKTPTPAIASAPFTLSPPSQTVEGYVVLVNPALRQAVAIPGVVGEIADTNFKVPSGWKAVANVSMPPPQVVSWLQANAVALLKQAQPG